MHLLIFYDLFALLLGSTAPNYDPVLKGIPDLPEQTVVDFMLFFCLFPIPTYTIPFCLYFSVYFS